MRALCLVLCLFVQAAAAQEDVGLVSALSGEVVLQKGIAKVFMKVREGDRFDVPPGAQLRLVYFSGSRQERWLGPASLRAGKRESEPLSGKPDVSVLPASAPQRLARIPELSQSALFGGVRVRGIKAPPATETEDSLREARATYAKMRRELPPDDLTPELFLYAALASGPDPGGEEASQLAARLRQR
jgi:hypothetical protein